MKSHSLRLVIALVAGAACTAPALAEERICTGRIGAIALDNVFVPDGKTCELVQTRLNGNVVVAGLNTHMEIWSPEAWNTIRANLDSAANVEQWAKLGI